LERRIESNRTVQMDRMSELRLSRRKCECATADSAVARTRRDRNGGVLTFVCPERAANMRSQSVGMDKASCERGRPIGVRKLPKKFWEKGTRGEMNCLGPPPAPRLSQRKIRAGGRFLAPHPRAAASAVSTSRADRACLERAADPLHRARINPKLLGDLAHAWPSRSRQSLPDSLFQLGGYPRTPEPFSLTLGPR
jgi:hypothetical protein